jgi:hypothetical protein
MGEVYVAQHPRLPRLDAIKILPAGLTGDALFRERFNREADLAATLYHAHIVGVHDRGEFDGQLWISMDYVEGTDAGELTRNRRGNLSVDDVLEIVGAVAEALDFAHERRLLHRDVKPANILLTSPATGRRRILLADFGIARQVDDISGLTSTNMAVGTISYAAPEQLMGEPLDGRADQYALAATAYHLLAGRPPFVHSNPAVVISKHLTAPPPSLTEARPELARLNDALIRGLAKDPAHRYPTCFALAATLHHAHQANTTAAATFEKRFVRLSRPSNTRGGQDDGRWRLERMTRRPREYVQTLLADAPDWARRTLAISASTLVGVVFLWIAVFATMADALWIAVLLLFIAAPTAVGVGRAISPNGGEQPGWLDSGETFHESRDEKDPWWQRKYVLMSAAVMAALAILFAIIFVTAVPPTSGPPPLCRDVGGIRLCAVTVDVHQGSSWPSTTPPLLPRNHGGGTDA